MQQRIDARELDLKTRLVSVNRVAKTVKGGRNMRFSALVVIGDENGHVGVRPGQSKLKFLKLSARQKRAQSAI